VRQHGPRWTAVQRRRMLNQRPTQLSRTQAIAAAACVAGAATIPSAARNPSCSAAAQNKPSTPITSGGQAWSNSRETTCYSGVAPYGQRHRMNVQRSSTCGGSCWRSYRDGGLLFTQSAMFGPAEGAEGSGEVASTCDCSSVNNNGTMTASWGCVNTCTDATGERRLSWTDTTNGSTWTDLTNSHVEQASGPGWTITNAPSDGVYYAARG
jgi:hypothetical protein